MLAGLPGHLARGYPNPAPVLTLKELDTAIGRFIKDYHQRDDSPEFKDAAGNITTAGAVSSEPLKIDKTVPDATFSHLPAIVYYGSTPAKVTVTDMASNTAKVEITYPSKLALKVATVLTAR